MKRLENKRRSSYKDIQQFIKILKETGELVTVTAEVDAELEITEITDRVSKKNGPALLFTKVKGSPFPVLMNAFGTYERMNASLGANTNDIAHDIEELLKLSNYMSIGRLFKRLPSFWRLLLSLPLKLPFTLGLAPCQQVIEEPDLSTIPILKCWPKDGGRFATLPLVFTKDPDTGRQNIGMYRLQVYDQKTTGMHWHLHKDGRSIFEKYRKKGQNMPVSVVIGSDPATIYASTAPLPDVVDEILFAGFLRKRPVPMVKSVTNNIYIPANSEFVLEGYVDCTEMREEGPFGDHTGYYSEKDFYPVFHLTKITRKKHPVYTATVVGQPPMEDCYMGKATERIFLPLLKMLATDIIDINFPLEGVFHNCIIVSIHKRYPAHAKKIMTTLWGYGQMIYTKMLIVVDKEVNPHNLEQVVQKVFENIEDKRDLVINEGPLDALDHASPLRFLGHRLGIDATQKWETEGYPKPCNNNNQEEPPKDLQAEIKRICPEVVGFHLLFKENVGCVILSIDKQLPDQVKKTFDSLRSFQSLNTTKIMIVVDKTTKADDLSKVAWKVFNNIDAQRDIVITENPNFSLRIEIDATKKGKEEGYVRDWPDDIEMTEAIKKQVTQRWQEYGIDD